MDSEDKKIIRENLEISKNNRKMLKKIRRGMFFSGIVRVIYWVIIIGASLGTYYYLQPYIESGLETLTKIQSGVGVVSDGVNATAKTTSEAVKTTTNVVESLFEIGTGFLGI